MSEENSPDPKLVQRVAILKTLGTKELVDRVNQLEAGLQAALVAEAKFKAENSGYLSSGGDCRVVKNLLAELAVQAPATIEDPSDSTKLRTKKASVADKEAWLQRQRKENSELMEAISKQAEIAMLLESKEIDLEMTKRRLTSALAIIHLKTAQIEFLANG